MTSRTICRDPSRRRISARLQAAVGAAVVFAAEAARGQSGPVSAPVTGSANVNITANADSSGNFSTYTVTSGANLTFNGGVQIVVPVNAVAGSNLDWNSNAAWNDPGIAPVDTAVFTPKYTDNTKGGTPAPQVDVDTHSLILSLAGGGPTQQILTDANYYTISVPGVISIPQPGPYSESYPLKINETFDVTIPGGTSMTLGQTEELQQLTVAAAASLTVTGNTTLTVSNAIYNRGLLVLAGGTLHGPIYNQGGTVQTTGPEQVDSVLQNPHGGTYAFKAGGSISGPGSIANGGLFQMTDGSGQSNVNVPLVDTGGTVSAVAGSLILDGGGSLAGTTFTPSTGATVTIGGGAFNLSGAIAVSGGGGVLISGGTAQAVGGSTTITGNDGTTLSIVSGGHLNAAANATLTLNLTGPSAVVLDPNRDYQSTQVVGDGPGTVINAGNFTWSYGGLIGNAADGSGGLTNTGTLTVDANYHYRVLYGTLVNRGTVVVAGSAGFGAAGVFNNTAGATVQFTADSASFGGNPNFVSVGGVLNNAGLIEKTAGTGASPLFAALNDSGGTISSSCGTLCIGGGGTLANTALSASPGAILQLGGNTLSLTGSITAGGGGIVQVGGYGSVYGGTVQAAAGTSATITANDGTTLTVRGGGRLNAAAGGTLILDLTGASSVVLDPDRDYQSTQVVGDGPGTVINAGNFIWSYGGLIGNAADGSGGLTNTGTFTIDANYDYRFLYGTLVNRGTVVVAGSAGFGPAGVFNNEPGGIVQATADVFQFGGNPNQGVSGGVLNNAGLVEKTAGTGISVIAAAFNDSAGTVAGTTGKISLTGGGTLFNTRLAPTAGATVMFGQGTFVMSGTVMACGGGTVQVGGNYESATVTVASGSATIAGSDGTILAVADSGHLNAATGATLTLAMTGTSAVVLDPYRDYPNYPTIGDGPGTVVNVGNLTWSNSGRIGAPDGTGGLTNIGTVTVDNSSGYAGRYLTGTLANHGLIVIAGPLGFTATGVLANMPDGEVAIGGDNVSVGSSTGFGAAIGTFTNSGLVEKTGGAGTSSVTADFINGPLGTLTVLNGTLSLTAGLTNSGTVTNPAGTTLSVGGVFQQSAPGLFTSAGTLVAGDFVNSGGTATFGGAQQWSPGHLLNNSGGSTTFTTDPGSTYRSPLSVLVAGGTVTFSSTDHLAAVNVSAGASAVVSHPPGGARSVLVTPSLTIAGSTGAWTGRLDLIGDDLDVPGGNLTVVSSMTSFGCAGGNWDGPGGIVSSVAAADSRHLTAVGVIQNDQGGKPVYTSSDLFDGVAPAPADILAKYTYYGDANLDGKVDGSDYSLIDAGYISGGATTGWYNGDFNYDGKVDGSDYTLIDNAFNRQGVQLTSAALVATPTALVAPTTVVPEPATGLTIIGVAVLARRRRRA